MGENRFYLLEDLLLFRCFVLSCYYYLFWDENNMKCYWINFIYLVIVAYWNLISSIWRLLRQLHGPFAFLGRRSSASAFLWLGIGRLSVFRLFLRYQLCLRLSGRPSTWLSSLNHLNSGSNCSISAVLLSAVAESCFSSYLRFQLSNLYYVYTT